jgi:hypothetical protein
MGVCPEAVVFHECLCKNLSRRLFCLECLRIVWYTKELILTPLENIILDVLKCIQHVVHRLIALHDFACRKDDCRYACESKDAHPKVEDVIASRYL